MDFYRFRMLGPKCSLDSRHRSIEGREGARTRERRGMHGNHQNWKGNKGVAEGAPLSLHGGCLATPASRSLPHPRAPFSLLPHLPLRNPSRLTTAPLYPRPTLRYPLHFFLLFPLPSAHHSRIRTAGIPMLSFSPVAQPPPALPHPWSTSRVILAPSARFLRRSLFCSAMYRRRNPRVLFPSRKLRFVALPPSLAHLQLARVYPLPR